MESAVVPVLMVMVALLFPAAPATADNARDWQNLPINTPVAFAYYYHMDSNTSLDTALPVRNASTEINAGLLRFAYAFDAGNGKSSGVQVLQTFADVDFSLGGTPFDKSRRGLGDTTVILATNLFGGPAYTVDEFVKAKPETFLTAALWVTAPTGRYDPKKVINLGANRWAFKPQLAFGHPFGKSWIEANAWLQFFTDNDDYLNGRTLNRIPDWDWKRITVTTLRPGSGSRPMCFTRMGERPRSTASLRTMGAIPGKAGSVPN